ncbi:MAG: sulfotransferase, partial [Rhizomicrobium sp.]
MTDTSFEAPTTASYETALAFHMQGRKAEAEQAYQAFLALHPDHGETLHGLGVLYLQNGQTDKAVTYLRQAVAVSGDNTTIRNNFGVALCAAHQFSEAAAVYRAAIEADPASVSSRLNLGQVLNHLGLHGEAVTVLTDAVARKADSGAVHNQLAIAFSASDAPDAAQKHFAKALALEPARDDFYCDYGAMLLKFKHPEQAEDCYRRALSIRPDAPVAVCGLGETLGAQNRHEDAVSCFTHAIALAPNYALAHYNCGTALTYLGRMSEAKAAFNTAVTLAPDNATFRSALIDIDKTASGNDHLAALETLAAKANTLPAEERIALHFTLAKAYDDTGDYERAFDEMQQGNAAVRRRAPYDVQRELDRFRAIAASFTAEFLATHAGSGAASTAPVFVVGMPRSGTTLVEQILASHPAVFGAGELAILPDLIASGGAGRDFPSAITTLDWCKLGEIYLQKLLPLAPQAQRITDKLPLNFQLIGLIRLALPQARIIHVMRNPLDCCLSNYSILFENGLEFTNDLSDLGRYYYGYRTLMNHWRAALPAGAMLEIQYENLVANFEAETRRLIGYCGLAWDTRCLDFHKTVRPVETASTIQVRQPLFSSSVGRALHYAPKLGPLCEALGEYCPTDAVQALQKFADQHPKAAQTHITLGNILMAQQRPQEALHHLGLARDIAPTLPEPYNNAGNILLDMGHTDAAQAAFEKAIALMADGAAPHIGLGRTLKAMNQTDAALAAFEKARARDPQSTAALLGMGECCLMLGRAQAAQAIFQTLTTRAPMEASHWLGLGEACKQLGQLSEARTACARAAALAPDKAGALYTLAQMGRFSPGDPRLTALEAQAARIDHLAPGEQIKLHFALGKAYDELGQHRQAFIHWQAGNQMAHTSAPYDEPTNLGMLSAITTAFSADRIAAHSGAGDPSPCPVFVVGMPRSGTTLVEQI